MKHIIYVDGGFRKEKGGYIAWLNEATGQTFYGPDSGQDSFRCEYAAIIHALENAKGIMQDDEVQIRSDNDTVAKQLNHEYAINDDGIRQSALKIWGHNERFQKPINFIWIPRAENKAGKIIWELRFLFSARSVGHLKA